jgi:hypothetical protein
MLYHGGVSTIEQPSVQFSKRNLDFGKGFYLTSYKEQAVRWAERKGMRIGSTPILNIYDFNSDIVKFKSLIFDENNAEWVDFVCKCRRGGKDYVNYDIIIGGVANDKVYLAVDMYYKGIWDMTRTLSELKYYERNDQYCIINQKVIDSNLKFLSSEVI